VQYVQCVILTYLFSPWSRILHEKLTHYTYLLIYLLNYLVTYLLTYLLTPWSRVLLEKLMHYTYLLNYLVTYLLTYLLHGAESFLRS